MFSALTGQQKLCGQPNLVVGRYDNHINDDRDPDVGDRDARPLACRQTSGRKAFGCYSGKRKS